MQHKTPNPLFARIMTNDEAVAKYCEAAEDYAACNINPTFPGEKFGIAWGEYGEVLTYEQTIEAIAHHKGWFDMQGHWVNYQRAQIRWSNAMADMEETLQQRRTK